MAKIKLEATPAQLSGICDAADTLEAMVGCSEDGGDQAFKRVVRLIDRFLESNGFRRV